MDLKDYKSNKQKFIADTENPIKIEGEILSSCPMKGCWMKIKSEEDTILVRFKDYGFFVPKDGIAGNKTIINGKLSIDTLSVTLLRHYACNFFFCFFSLNCLIYYLKNYLLHLHC